MATTLTDWPKTMATTLWWTVSRDGGCRFALPRLQPFNDIARRTWLAGLSLPCWPWPLPCLLPPPSHLPWPSCPPLPPDPERRYRPRQDFRYDSSCDEHWRTWFQFHWFASLSFHCTYLLMYRNMRMCIFLVHFVLNCSCLNQSLYMLRLFVHSCCILTSAFRKNKKTSWGMKDWSWNFR